MNHGPKASDLKAFRVNKSNVKLLQIIVPLLHQQAGDEIVLVRKMDDDWYIGRLGDQQGMFPVKFVEIIEDLPQEMEPETQVNIH